MLGGKETGRIEGPRSAHRSRIARLSVQSILFLILLHRVQGRMDFVQCMSDFLSPPNKAQQMTTPVVEHADPASPLIGVISSMKNIPRMLYFFKESIPFLLRYRFEEWRMRFVQDKEERERRWNNLHDEFAPKAFNSVQFLKGYYIKLGQVVSSKGDLPHQFVEICSALQDEVHSMGEEQVRRLLRSELRTGLEDVFESFDFRPVGSASIGQCHAAKLRTGEQVCVKVMNPDAESFFRSDLFSAKLFCRFAMPEWNGVIDEIEKQFLSEFDYTKEARNLQEMRENLEKRFHPSIARIPRVYPHLCTKSILVMEYFSGKKIIAFVRDLTSQLLDKHKGNKRLQEFVNENSTVDAAFVRTEVLRSQRYSSSSSSSSSPSFVQPSSFFSSLLNLPLLNDLKYLYDFSNQIFQNALEVHGSQILLDGAFNGDPHPGNILISPSGALELIDFGQVKRLTEQQRRDLANMLVYLADGKLEDAQDLFVRMGFRTKKMDPYVIQTMAILYFDRDSKDVTQGMDARSFVEKLQQRDNFESVPNDYIMVARTSVLLRGLGSRLGKNVSIAKAWRHLAEQVLNSPTTTQTF
uniref:Protein kinase domain-containing protein n=1 Tax=Guillardia theta TaxID=55529 RepID=A0A7S4NNQ9_GUITH|mmetsp:Transcript_27793/g.90415  ORF Transcript_27793/g.90415 Transcript_27793/m.90415 type:complete len:580 (+) Transcript_27793:2-1741(+)